MFAETRQEHIEYILKWEKYLPQEPEECMTEEELNALSDDDVLKHYTWLVDLLHSDEW